MLKSTHVPLRPPALSPVLPPLPKPWTEHRAPSGHTYFYNAETQQSTYVRPVDSAVFLPSFNATLQSGSFHTRSDLSSYDNLHTSAEALFARPQHVGWPPKRQRRQPGDRPKSKHALPGCEPWILVKTKLGRRFVHNLDTKESFWKIPDVVLCGVEEYDFRERVSNVEREGSTMDKGQETQQFGNVDNSAAISNDTTQSKTLTRYAPSTSRSSKAPTLDRTPSVDDYDEEDDTHSELEEESSMERRRSEHDGAKTVQTTSFGEDDMARQLALMGETYDLDPEEYGHRDAGIEQASEHGAVLLTEDEAQASFVDLLDEFNINPFSTWDSVVSEGFVVEDDRYTLLPNMKRRKEVFSEWSATKIHELKLEKDKAIRHNPKIAFLKFIQQHASPKLFWDEFRRKYKKDQAMTDSRLHDKEREQMYRDHIKHITKLSEAERKRNLQALLNSLPCSSGWCSSTTVRDHLPTALLSDVRYISLKPAIRDVLISAHLSSLPSLENIKNSVMSTSRLTCDRDQADALKQREVHVDQERKRQQKQRDHERSKLLAEDEELRLAMKVGKAGLSGHVQNY